ncbi:MAG: hypothetical protein IPH43_16250 [Xanthomonadales bacterium]|nr:hypothetical protein [Xanthomonadales bacterium]
MLLAQGPRQQPSDVPGISEGAMVLAFQLKADDLQGHGKSQVKKID